MRVLVATELVVAVRALRLAGPRAGRRRLAGAVRAAPPACLDAELGDRPLHPDVTAACALIERRAARRVGCAPCPCC